MKLGRSLHTANSVAVLSVAAQPGLVLLTLPGLAGGQPGAVAVVTLQPMRLNFCASARNDVLAFSLPASCLAGEGDTGITGLNHSQQEIQHHAVPVWVGSSQLGSWQLSKLPGYFTAWSFSCSAVV